MSIKDLAREAYQRRQAETAEKVARERAEWEAKEKARREALTESTRRTVISVFGAEPEHVADLDVVLEGIRLQRTGGSASNFYLVMTCRGCGKDITYNTRPIYGLADLGEVLAQVEALPEYHSYCRSPEPEPEPEPDDEESTPAEPQAPLVDRAREAHKRQLVEDAEYQRGRTERDFREAFDCTPEAIEGNVVRHEGMVLERDAGGYAAFRLRGVCPDCGQAVLSDPVSSVQGLGKLLASFEPCRDHHERCPAKPAAEVCFAEQLVRLLDARYVRQEEE